MLTGKQIEITIDQIGRPTVEAKGFQGVGCKAATKGLIDKLSGGTGGAVTVDKPELAMVDTTQTQHQHLCR